MMILSCFFQNNHGHSTLSLDLLKVIFIIHHVRKPFLFDWGSCPSVKSKYLNAAVAFGKTSWSNTSLQKHGHYSIVRGCTRSWDQAGGVKAACCAATDCARFRQFNDSSPLSGIVLSQFTESPACVTASFSVHKDLSIMGTPPQNRLTRQCSNMTTKSDQC